MLFAQWSTLYLQQKLFEGQTFLILIEHCGLSVWMLLRLILKQVANGNAQQRGFWHSMGVAPSQLVAAVVWAGHTDTPDTDHFVHYYRRMCLVAVVWAGHTDTPLLNHHRDTCLVAVVWAGHTDTPDTYHYLNYYRRVCLVAVVWVGHTDTPDIYHSVHYCRRVCLVAVVWARHTDTPDIYHYLNYYRRVCLVAVVWARHTDTPNADNNTNLPLRHVSGRCDVGWKHTLFLILDIRTCYISIRCNRSLIDCKNQLKHFKNPLLF